MDALVKSGNVSAYSSALQQGLRDGFHVAAGGFCGDGEDAIGRAILAPTAGQVKIIENGNL